MSQVVQRFEHNMAMMNHTMYDKIARSFVRYLSFNHCICRGHIPDIVVYTQSTNHVSQVVKYCAAKRLPLIPFGTGTGLEGKQFTLNILLFSYTLLFL